MHARVFAMWQTIQSGSWRCYMYPSQIRATLQFRSNFAVTRARNCMGRPCSFSTDLDEIKLYILIGAVQIKGDE